MLVNCGCKERREILFTEGQPGKTEIIIIGVTAIALLTAILLKVKK